MQDVHSDQYLSFFVGDEEFGLGILEAREITQYPAVTKVPAMSRTIRGVINLRGCVVPIVDLALRFDLPQTPPTQFTCVVVVDAIGDGSGVGFVGLVVDRMSRVLELPARDIEPPPEFGTRVQRPFLRGMGRVDKKFVLLLSLDAVLSSLQDDVAELEDGGEPAVPEPTAERS